MREQNYYIYEEYKKEILDIFINERLECYYHPEIKKIIKLLCTSDDKVINVSENKRSDGLHGKCKHVYTSEGGLTDIIIVPSEYSYETPVNQYLSIEIKAPNLDVKNYTVTRYNKIKVKNNIGQINVQFSKTNFIIFTDTITWYLIKKDTNITRVDEISLLNASQHNWEWKEVDEWKRLMDKIEGFIKKSKKEYSIVF